ncbi:hypothetical protein HPB49_020121 [Dermacentor silvarum]|uniref:Uncharacterized protein n=1 Tax=Dermacentor silvarum TaxID=543639 RepID=A0ACB8E2U5_DERSI|nr:hypothetical protein HPB49_020121 [Dermacentor silvarum]
MVKRNTMGHPSWVVTLLENNGPFNEKEKRGRQPDWRRCGRSSAYAGSNARCRPDHAGIKSKIIRGGRMPPLPKEEAKIIVRPRGGLCISKVGPTAVADAIWQAVGLDSVTRDTDTMCPDFQKK